IMHRVILSLLFLFSSSLSVDPICNTNCDISHATDDSCFRNTIAFLEKSLMTTLRNYVDVQIRLQRIRTMYEEPELTVDEMVGRTLNNMRKAPFLVYEDSVFDIDNNAKSVVTELAKNVQSTSSEVALPSVECPQGCEETSTLWMGLFLASLALNLVLLVMAVSTVLFITAQNERKARLLLKKSLETEKKKLTEKGRKEIVRDDSDDEIVPSKKTLDPKKWETSSGERRESHRSIGSMKSSHEGMDNTAYETDRF
ncbi:hypothetical protein PFISCL1PPCAC_23916, partial [Pristionchus fissidentatus]